MKHSNNEELDSKAFAIGYKDGFEQKFKVNVEVVLSSLLDSINDDTERTVLIGYARGYYDGLCQRYNIDNNYQENQIDDASTLDADKDLTEGAKTQVYANRYERNSEAREQCIAQKGYKCSVCGMSFEEVYGELGSGFIHVHHIVPISQIGKNYKIDVERDLVPVCPNCHAMLHRNSQRTLTVDELRQILKANRHE